MNDRQGAVTNNNAGKQFRMQSGNVQPDIAAPILTEQGDIMKVKSFDKLFQTVNVTEIAVVLDINGFI